MGRFDGNAVEAEFAQLDIWINPTPFPRQKVEAFLRSGHNYLQMISQFIDDMLHLGRRHSRRNYELQAFNGLPRQTPNYKETPREVPSRLDCPSVYLDFNRVYRWILLFPLTGDW